MWKSHTSGLWCLMIHIQHWNGRSCALMTLRISSGFVWALKGKETTITIINICAKYFFFFRHSTKKMTPFFIPHNGNKSNYKNPSTSFAFEVFIIVGKIIFFFFFFLQVLLFAYMRSFNFQICIMILIFS